MKISLSYAVRLVVTVSALSVSHAFADMLIVFNNRVVGVVNAPVSRPDGTGAGAGVTAQLCMVSDDGKLTALTPTTSFRTSLAAAEFFVQPTQVTIPGIKQGAAVKLRLRAWAGATFDSSPLRGESNDFELKNSSAVNNLTGLKECKLAPPKGK